MFVFRKRLNGSRTSRPDCLNSCGSVTAPSFPLCSKGETRSGLSARPGQCFFGGGGGFGVSSKCFYGAASHDGLSQTVVEININLNE